MSNRADEFKEAYSKIMDISFPDEITNRYEIVKSLAKKPDREIFLCTEKENGKHCVLKTADHESIDNLEHEYEFLSKLSHEGIPKVYTYCTVGNKKYVVREYAEGETLDVLVARDGVFNETATLEIVLKLCDIISYLHKQNPPIIFRDIKPQNIVITPNGTMKLIDFGIARHFDNEKPFDTQFLGSIEFAAPEQFGFKNTDLRSDVYAIGKLMIFLATGSSDLQQYKNKIKSPVFLKIAQKSVSFSPEKRYATIEKLKQIVEKTIYPPSKTPLFVCMGAAVFVITLSLGLWQWLYNQNRDMPSQMEMPINAAGDGLSNMPIIDVPILVLMNDIPFHEVTISSDDIHWFSPTLEARATLEVLPDTYNFLAAYENQVAIIEKTVDEYSKDGIVFHMDALPKAPHDFLTTLNFDEDSELLLDIVNADEAVIKGTGAPNGVSIINKDGAFYLSVSNDVLQPGAYAFTIESKNEYGYATTIVAIILEQKVEPVLVHTAQDLEKIRDNLAGYFVLANDIDMSGYGNWTPVGNNKLPFTGVFDGSGFEISGLTINGGIQYAGIFGYAKNAVVRNIVLRDVNITLQHQNVGGMAGIVGTLENGLIENCAVIGGFLDLDIGVGSSAGGICGENWGYIKNCFNSADVFNKRSFSKDLEESNLGGICGVMTGYVSNCGNNGNIKGIWMTGGIVGFIYDGRLSNCYNTGQVDGIEIYGEFPPGGIVQILAAGQSVSYCYFDKTSAVDGARVTSKGVLLGLEPINKEDFRNGELLQNLGSFKEENATWGYASIDLYYPIPKGIFKDQAEIPILPANGLNIDIPAKENIKYFYTIDGQNPYTANVEGSDSVNITLKAGQTIQIFAAEKGKYDSEIVSYKAS